MEGTTCETVVKCCDIIEVFAAALSILAVFFDPPDHNKDKMEAVVPSGVGGNNSL